jgi:hypothetical protein
MSSYIFYQVLVACSCKAKDAAATLALLASHPHGWSSMQQQQLQQQGQC